MTADYKYLRSRSGGRQLASLDERVGKILDRTGYGRKILFGERPGKYTLDAQEMIEFQSWMQRSRDVQVYLEGERLHPGKGHRYWALRLRLGGRVGI